MSYDLSSYTDVKTKIELFIEKYPEGSIQFVLGGVCAHNPEMIWGQAFAYRSPDDARPGVGTAQELAIGKTNFTRGSELQNLETSAWGRAISALGIGLTAGIATRDEVRGSQERSKPVMGTTPKKGSVAVVGGTGAIRYVGGEDEPPTDKQNELMQKLVKGDVSSVLAYKEERGIMGGFTKAQASDFIKFMMSKEKFVLPDGKE
jgi:hypothetical protein